MEMAELVEMIQDRQGKKSIEQYANEMGLRGATLFRFYKGQREISVSSLRKMAEYYRLQGDRTMVSALAAYALGFDHGVSTN